MENGKKQHFWWKIASRNARKSPNNTNFPRKSPLVHIPLTNKIKIMQKFTFVPISTKIYFCRNMGHSISIFYQIGPLYIYSGKRNIHPCTLALLTVIDRHWRVPHGDNTNTKCKMVCTLGPRDLGTLVLKIFSNKLDGWI